MVVSLGAVEAPPRASAADQVFEALYRQIISLKLEPGEKVSEIEVARAIGVSRQPVRDAFYRLSRLGFLLIRPQRATTVTPISARAVLEARFVRTALEVETVRVAAGRVAAGQLAPERLAALEAQMGEQEAAMRAGDRARFHALDDGFHRLICELAGVGFAWALIREVKAHMDRVRWLSLAFNAPSAYADHEGIMAALRHGDPLRAAEAMRGHLGKIEGLLEQIRAENRRYFAEEPE